MYKESCKFIAQAFIVFLLYLYVYTQDIFYLKHHFVWYLRWKFINLFSASGVFWELHSFILWGNTGNLKLILCFGPEDDKGFLAMVVTIS